MLKSLTFLKANIIITEAYYVYVIL